MYARMTHAVFRWLWLRMVRVCEAVRKDEDACNETLNQAIEWTEHLSEHVPNIIGVRGSH